METSHLLTITLLMKTRKIKILDSGNSQVVVCFTETNVAPEVWAGTEPDCRGSLSLCLAGQILKKKGQRAQSQNLEFQVASLPTHLAPVAFLDRTRHTGGWYEGLQLEEGMKQR